MLYALSVSGQNWRQLFRQNGVEPAEYVRKRDKDEMFPWDIVDHGMKRNYLWAEYQRALKEKKTEACDTQSCKRCGVCADTTRVLLSI